MKIKKLLLATLLILTGCSMESIENNNIVVGASSTPHALILEQARDYIKEAGYTLEIKVMTDYVTPNIALSEGELDANYFQHRPFMEDFNKSQGKVKIESAASIHFEPMGIYQGSALNNKIIVPNDSSNYERAIELLKENGFTGELIQAEAQVIPLMLNDCQYACINGNYALSSNILDKVLVTETKDTEIAERNANIIACRNGEKEKTAIKLLVEALTQDKIREFIKKEFGSAVIPMF